MSRSRGSSKHAGVHVAYGVVGLKTHCKCSLVIRREQGEGEAGIRAYAHIGTGNYHPRTAQLYTDLGILTADPVVTGDVVKIFNSLTGHAAEQQYGSLVVAPGRCAGGSSGRWTARSPTPGPACPRGSSAR